MEVTSQHVGVLYLGENRNIYQKCYNPAPPQRGETYKVNVEIPADLNVPLNLWKFPINVDFSLIKQ